jgi:hypothetical protein
MSDGQRCLIRDLGLVKGGKRLRHHKVVIELSRRGVARFTANRIRAFGTNRKAYEPVRIRDAAGLIAD